MKILERSALVALLVLTAISCSERSSITGSYGQESLEGQVVMGGELITTSAAGIEVSVIGTGMTTITDEEGRFAFAGLPSGAISLTLRRGDGIDTTETVAAGSESVLIPMVTRRGRGRATEKPKQAIDGEVISSSDTSILVDSVRHGEVEILLEEETLIVKGSVTLIGSEIAEGEMIRARVRTTDLGFVAELVKVRPQHRGDDSFLPASVVGEVTSNAEGTLTVVDEHGQEFTILTDERTEVYKKNFYLQVDEIEVGDRVKVFGFNSDEGLVASWIRVKPNSDDDAEDDELEKSIEGIVTAVSDDSFDVQDEGGLIVTVRVDANTELKERGRPIALEDIEVGDSVTAIGEREDETTLHARKVIVHNEDDSGDDDETKISIEGDVVAVADGSISVDDGSSVYMVLIDSFTNIRKKNIKIDASDIEIGSSVGVKGVLTDPTTIEAAKITVK